MILCTNIVFHVPPVDTSKQQLSLICVNYILGFFKRGSNQLQSTVFFAEAKNSIVSYVMDNFCAVPSMRIPGLNEAVVYAASKIKCALVCKLADWCFSVNYNKDSEHCVLGSELQSYGELLPSSASDSHISKLPCRC